MTDKKYEDYLPVFRLKPNSYSNSSNLKLVSYMHKNENLGDEQVEFETSEDNIKLYGKNVDYVGNVMNYDITAYIFKNNIVGSYLINNSYIPVYSLSFVFAKQIVKGPLFDICIGYELDRESRNSLKPKNMINALVNGSYTMKIVCDDEVSNSIEDFLKELPEKLILLPEIYKVVNDLPTETAENFLKRIIKDTITNYRELFKGIKMEQFKTHTKMVEELRKIYKINYFNLFLEFCLKKREEKRRKEYKAVEKYEIPKRVLNIKDVENNPEYVDKYLGLE